MTTLAIAIVILLLAVILLDSSVRMQRRGNGIRLGAITFTGLAVIGLTACAQPTAPAPPSPIVTSTNPVPAPATIIVPPPETVYVVPPKTVTAPPKATQTSCQWLRANGYSYAQMATLWAQDRFPMNWDADRDGYPCEQSYGNQN
jgi:hypothetical protein